MGLSERVGVVSDDGSTELVNILTHKITGLLAQPRQELTASGAVTSKVRIIELNHASTPVVATMPELLTVGEWLVVVNTSASGTAAHTLTLYGTQTWDGTNTIATLDAPAELLLCYCKSATALQVVLNTGSVAFSSP